MNEVDRELLELAAKAAGYEYLWNIDSLIIRGLEGHWNTLTDDGDALRLALKCGISLEIDANIEVYFDGHDGDYEKGVEAWKVTSNGDIIKAEELYRNDPLAATRRAITRIAAEIGRNMT